MSLIEDLLQASRPVRKAHVLTTSALKFGLCRLTERFQVGFDSAVQGEIPSP